jgi:predicted MPP superfamily phosphohydrolase
MSDEFVLDTFSRVASLQPDIVVVTGDFTSYHDDVLNHAERIYSQFPHGRLGTVGVLGNHDYGPGWSDPVLANHLTALLQNSGIRILRNEHLNVEGLQIVGMDDLWANNFRPAQAIAALDPQKSMLALSHNPDSVDLSGWDGFKGWILSGHTHGGQCKPPFLPPPLLPVENRMYTEGEFTLEHSRSLYINRGVGHLLQMRFNVRPEVTVFELQSE